VNESLWEIRTNTKLIQELEGQTAELTKNYNNLLGRMAERQAYMIEYFDFFINLDTAFASVKASLQWLQDLADALDEGLDLLANGRLAPQIFPPAQMALVLKAVNRQLPLGWAVSNDELWVTYREVMVTGAAVEGRFRLFIKIPHWLSLQWLRDLADALDEGLDLLANGRLAPQIFPPAQMALVLKAVNRQLPLGWAVSNDELWVTYREAMVTGAAVEGRFRLFIKIPIYDHAQQSDW
jgi:hypothetical protein